MQKIIANKTIGAVLQVLNSASIHPAMNHCPDCGLQLRYLDCTFSYEGAAWDIPLSFCLNCDSITKAHLQ